MICTLKDIATALNTTVNTVSRALKDKSDISQSMRDRVQQKAAEMGYVPNLNARCLRTKQTRAIAVVYDNFSNPYFSIMTGFLQYQLSKKKYNIIIFSDWSESNRLSEKTVRQILSRGVDGIISFLEVEDGALQMVKNANKYILVLGRDSSTQGVDSITTDDFRGGYLATKHLIDMGHRKILLFSVSRNISCALLRYNGYKKALEESGIEALDEYTFYQEGGFFSGADLINEADRRGIDYTAIFCFNDLIAYEAICELTRCGKSVPDDVSVIGYDYIESDLHLPVGLSSVDTDKRQIADVAVELMLYKMENTTARSFNKLHEPIIIEGRTIKRLN